MPKYILFDTALSENLLPLTYTKPCSELRLGILTIREKWERYLGTGVLLLPFRPYLREKYGHENQGEAVYINSQYLPHKKLVGQIKELSLGDGLISNDKLIATYSSNPDKPKGNLTEVEYPISKVSQTFDFFSINGEELKRDFELLTKGRISEPIPASVSVVSEENIFIEKDAELSHCVLNASSGPIYIASNAIIMEGATVRGGLAMAEHSVLKMGARIYGPTTLGPHCKIGGEVNNVIFNGFTSKAHDGYLGNSVIGEWCNLGADTNSSNLKNNYASVRLWNYQTKGFKDTGLQFCGLIMGDHSKCGINTMFNTGTVVGVGANIFGSGFPRNFIPSYSWGGSSGFTNYRFNKFCEATEKVLARRNKPLDQTEISILQAVYEETNPNK